MRKGAMDMITGAEAIVRCLRAEDVSLVFGYPGATIAPFYDALCDSGIRHILTRSEQGAGHAASGYARMTGRPGVCVATSGPGATNLFTAIATAYSDSIPMVAITGQVATGQLGRDVFQEVDTTGAAEPFTKYCTLVKSVQELPRVMKEAFHIASTGRMGPVLVDIPVDVQQEALSFSYPDTVNIRGCKPRIEGHPMQVRKVAAAISGAKRPVVCLGGGIFLSGAADRARAFCERIRIPAVSTMMGIGVLPRDHLLYFGMLGSHGVSAANTAVRKSDLLIIIGARVGDRAITRPADLEPETTIIHIDIDTAEIGKNVGTTIPLVGDAGHVLEQLVEHDIRGDWQEWAGHLAALREEYRQREEKHMPGSGVDPRAFVRTLCGQLPDTSVYVADVGQNQIWSANHYTAKGRFLTTGGMGTMGYSIPAAMGAKLALPDHTVLAVCGDGSFQMSMNELATMCQHGADVKIVMFRNGVLGMVRELQDKGYGRHFAVDLDGSPDFGAIAAAYGITYARVETMDHMEEGIRALLESDGAFLLECVVDPHGGSL
jgi:acetolactate synthase-1/2/3 large subunit